MREADTDIAEEVSECRARVCARSFAFLPPKNKPELQPTKAATRNAPGMPELQQLIGQDANNDNAILELQKLRKTTNAK